MSEQQIATGLPPVEAMHASESFKADVLQAAIREGYLAEEFPIASFVNCDDVQRTISALNNAFPAHFQHTFAAKANSMQNALRLVKAAGMGCEVASPGELEQALRVGFAPQQIVYDEPAKTPALLQKILAAGINLNIDNFQEFARVARSIEQQAATSKIGFRINPQVGAGKIGAMSTATRSSKFGVALDDADNRARLIDCYQRNAWLTSIHTHIGSQGCPLELMTAGIHKVVELADEINAAIGHQQISVIDIGGGLPVNFSGPEVTPTFSDYAAALRNQVPRLFDGDLVVKTEFGRAIFAKSGFIAARVEYTKNSGGRQIAITHAGAQIAARTALMPDLWKIRLGVFDRDGNAKTANLVVQDVAGPCCFAGDIIAHARELPLIEPGDFVMLHDTGAYYFSNPFFYNCLPASAVYGASASEDNAVRFETWRQAQSLDNLLAVLG